jgi:hypothetical protein
MKTFSDYFYYIKFDFNNKKTLKKEKEILSKH